MTGYTVHTGSSEKFVAGWDQIFSGGKRTLQGSQGKAQAPKAEKGTAGQKADRKAKRGKKG